MTKSRHSKENAGFLGMNLIFSAKFKKNSEKDL